MSDNNDLDSAIVEIQRYLNYKRGNYTGLENAIEKLIYEYKLLDKKYNLLNDRIIDEIINGRFSI